MQLARRARQPVPCAPSVRSREPETRRPCTGQELADATRDPLPRAEAGEHHEHLVDVETGDVIEFYHAELEALKEQIAREMGYELVDHRLELFGRKIKDQ